MSSIVSQLRVNKNDLMGIIKNAMENIIGSRLKALRKSLGLSQSDFADELNIARSSVSEYESGKKIPSALVIAKIAQYFGVSADYLLGLTDNPTPCNNELPQHIKKELEECKKLKEFIKTLKSLMNNLQGV